MPNSVRQLDYFETVISNGGPQPAEIVAALAAAGVDLLAFSLTPLMTGESQVTLVAEDPAALERAARQCGLKLIPQRSAFLIRGEKRSGELAALLKLVAQGRIQVHGIHAIAGAAEFDALLWVAPADAELTAKIMTADAGAFDEVDEASRESFPASDAPAWTGGHD